MLLIRTGNHSKVFCSHFFHRCLIEMYPLNYIFVHLFSLMIIWYCENALLSEGTNTTEKETTRTPKQWREKRISNTNKLNPYILPSINRPKNPLLLRMRCMEGEQWRRQQKTWEKEQEKRRREKAYRNVMHMYHGNRLWQI